MIMYTVDPPIFCELKDPQIASDNADCLTCKPFPLSEPTAEVLIALKNHHIHLNEAEPRTYLPESVVHLNGVPFIKIDNPSFEGTYLGILHLKNVNKKWNTKKQTSQGKITYPHHFVRVMSDPPFSIIDISTKIPLQIAYPAGPWFETERDIHEGEIAFISGFEYQQKSSKIYLSYGAGDAESRVLILTIDEVRDLFKDAPDYLRSKLSVQAPYKTMFIEKGGSSNLLKVSKQSLKNLSSWESLFVGHWDVDMPLLSKSHNVSSEVSAGYQCPITMFASNYMGDLPHQSRLFCERNVVKSHIPRRSASLRWVPTGSDTFVSRLDPERVAHKHANNRIVFIGDSITAQQYYSFICKVGNMIDEKATKKAQLWLFKSKATPPYLPKEGPLPEMGKQNDVYKLRGGAKAVFIASDFLVSINETDGHMDVPMIGVYMSDKCWDARPDRGSGAWPLMVRQGPASKDDVVVINSGQHWLPERAFSCMDGDWPSEDIDEMVEKEYTKMVQTVLHWFKSSTFQGELFYRDNYAGYEGCEARTFPDLYPAEVGDIYNWQAMTKMNTVWRDAAKELYPKMKFLSIEGMSVLRGDAHYGAIIEDNNPSSYMDCIHFCSPGPVDTWNDILFGQSNEWMES
jgi:hypothetical protein